VYTLQKTKPSPSSRLGDCNAALFRHAPPSVATDELIPCFRVQCGRMTDWSERGWIDKLCHAIVFEDRSIFLVNA
jgi:hypothetical protein